MTVARTFRSTSEDWARRMFLDGEQVLHLYPNDLFYSHLSIYCFASRFCRDRVVVDGGSGTGYGAKYLAENGAVMVYGIDASKMAIDFSINHFKRDNLVFRRKHLEELDPGLFTNIDVIVASNVLEHVDDVQSFLKTATNVLVESGTVVIAVPPIIHKASVEDNLRNPYHVNIWSPRQWQSVVSLFFEEVQCYTHEPKVAMSVGWDSVSEMREAAINEHDFNFDPVSVQEWLKSPSMTFIMVARYPRAPDLVPTGTEPIQFVDGSFTTHMNHRVVTGIMAVRRVRRWFAPGGSRREQWTKHAREAGWRGVIRVAEMRQRRPR